MDTQMILSSIIIALLAAVLLLQLTSRRRSDLGEIMALLKRSSDEQRESVAKQISNATTHSAGYTAKEIAGILCLSINTIKTHNRRIYMKLNVTSRKELMVYIQMMEEMSCANAQSN